MSHAAEIVRLKLLGMTEQLAFLDFVWEGLTQDQKDYFRNNYAGKLPKRYQ